VGKFDSRLPDVDASTVVQSGVLQPFRRIELVMGPAGVVKNLGEDPYHMLVVVEDLVVIAAAGRARRRAVCWQVRRCSTRRSRSLRLCQSRSVRQRRAYPESAQDPTRQSKQRQTSASRAGTSAERSTWSRRATTATDNSQQTPTGASEPLSSELIHGVARAAATALRLVIPGLFRRFGHCRSAMDHRHSPIRQLVCGQEARQPGGAQRSPIKSIRSLRCEVGRLPRRRCGECGLRLM
jgi:hypothetical protein